VGDNQNPAPYPGGGEKRSDDALLKEIRDDFAYFKSYWRENYEEAKTDLQFVAGDPWDGDARQQREKNGRPVISPDEFSQYLNATINNLRQNPIGIKIEPKGDGADDKTAEMRQALIRNIENDSIAQAAYTNAYSNAINCGFGFFRVTTKRVKKGSDDVEPRIKIINNPLSVLMDPNAKEADFSDMKRCFVLDVMRKSDFKRQYPKAEHLDFSPDDIKLAPDWCEAENVVVAEYWRIDGYDEDGDGGKVKQYITNGLEILSETNWAGSRIPIIPVLGKETYIPQGGKMARMFYSMVRTARGMMKLLAYIVSQEAEEYGMAPRAPFVGYVGQFETDGDRWANANKVPTAFLQVDPVVDQTSNQVLPLPTRPAFQPNAQAYEVGKESARRGIQAAMGITPLPTAAQRQNEKSGVALQHITQQQAVGSFHFTANYKMSLGNAGWQLNELISKIIDTPRQMAGRQQDGEQSLIQVAPNGQGGPPAPTDGSAAPETFDPTKGEFDVTISSGPSYQSQRDAANDFADTLVGEMGNLPVPPQQKMKLLAMAVKLKDIGPLGDEMADILDPQQDGQLPPQAQAQMAQMQQELQQAHQSGMELHQQVMQLEFEKKAQIVKNQGDMALQKLKIEADLAKAEIETKAQVESERWEFVKDTMSKLLDQKHEGAMKAHDIAHEVGMAGMQQQHQQETLDQQAQNQSAQSAQDADQQQAMQPPDDSQE
jgi:hypothetical protein